MVEWCSYSLIQLIYGGPGTPGDHPPTPPSTHKPTERSDGRGVAHRRLYMLPRSLFYDELDAEEYRANPTVLAKKKANIVAELVRKFDPKEFAERWFAIALAATAALC